MEQHAEPKPVIFFCHNVSVIGGAERVTLSAADNIKPYYQPVLLCPAGPLQEAAKKRGIAVQTVNWFQPELRSPIASYLNKRKLVKLIKRYRPICLHTGDILALRAAASACKTTHVPLIAHVHFPYQTSFMDWVFKSQPPVNTFIYCSQELMDNVGGYLHSLVPTSRNVLVHNGIDVSKFVPSRETDSSSTGKLQIGIVGNLQKRKGHDDFLYAAKQVLDNGYHVEFHIIGGDILEEPREPKLKQLVSELGIAEYVTFHGQVDDVTALVGQLDIMVCASHEEAFPITILEAMACAKAIVSTNVNGIPEAMDDSCGIMVSPHSPEQLARGMETLITDTQMREAMGMAARNKVVERFSEAVFINKIRAIYSALVDA